MNYGFLPGRSHLVGPGSEELRSRPPRRARVFLDDVEISTQYVKPPQRGRIWLVDNMEGWWEPADDSSTTVASPAGDGLLATSQRFGARTIILSTWVQAAPGEYELVDETLELVSRLRNSVLRVEEPRSSLSREANVRLLGVRTSRPSAARADVTLTLQADDPLRYGTTTQELKNGRNILVNPGDATAFPIIEVRGPHNAITITHDGGVFKFPALTSSQRRTIDCRNGDVWAGDSRAFVGSGAWPRVGVGGAEWQISGLGAGTATVRRFQAWT